jgi:protein arginine N-methyltransferase 3
VRKFTLFPIADKLTNCFRLIRGKVESIELPEGISKVDVIVSEWMGYCLLYESMLDSVLVARNRFLRPPAQDAQANDPGGVMAPSQCRMMLALCDPEALIKQRIGFWNEVHGFDMSVMAEEVFDEAIIEVVPKECLLSTPCIVKVSLFSITQVNYSYNITGY